MVYFVKTDKNRLFCFYYSKSSIYCREYENNKWQNQSVLTHAGSDKFSVDLTQDQTMRLLYQDKEKNASVMKFEKNTWSAALSLNTELARESVAYFVGNSLVYTGNDEEGGQGVFLKQRDEIRLDRINILGGSAIQLQKISPEFDHSLLFYNAKRTEAQLAYRELVPGKTSDIISIYSSGFPISDVSFLTTDDSINVAIAVKGMFSNQLLFKRKTEGEFAKQLVVWEGQRLEKIILSIIGGMIYVHFVSGGILYFCSSTDEGKSFSRAQICKFPMAPNTEKANFISAKHLNETDFFVRELLVNKENPWLIQILPELYDGFYPSGIIQEEQEVVRPLRNAEPAPKTHYEVDQDFFSRGFSAFGIKAQNETEYNSDYISRLRNKISDLEQENNLLKKKLKETEPKTD